MEFYENFDLQQVVTPVDVHQLEKLLIESKYDKMETEFLIKGFKQGFTLGYQGKTEVKMTAKNLKVTDKGHYAIIWNKVMKEVKLKCYAGPFTAPPFEHFIQSLIGLVPKDSGKDHKLIFHLSYPRNSGLSVNANTPQELTTVKYPDFNKAVKLCMGEGVGCHISRSDMKSALRNLGILRKHWKYLILKAKNPVDGHYYFFVDKAMAFRASISCSHFQHFSNSVALIIKYCTGRDNLNYLDNYLFAALIKLLCNAQVTEFLKVCELIKFPVSLEKTFWASMCMTFLGMLLDTVNQCVCIPLEKLQKARNMIQGVLTKRSKNLTLKQLQSICGYLNFLCHCIVGMVDWEVLMWVDSEAAARVSGVAETVDYFG